MAVRFHAKRECRYSINGIGKLSSFKYKRHSYVMKMVCLQLAYASFQLTSISNYIVYNWLIFLLPL